VLNNIPSGTLGKYYIRAETTALEEENLREY